MKAQASVTIRVRSCCGAQPRSAEIRADLGWQPQHRDLTGIVRDAWEIVQRSA